MENTEQNTKKTIPQIIFGSAIWTCVLAYLLIIAGQLCGHILMNVLGVYDSDLGSTAGMYFLFIGIWAVLFLNALIKKNRPLFKAYGTGLSGNRIPELVIGLLVGFGMNGILILFAIMHGDIHLYFDRFSIIFYSVIFASTDRLRLPNSIKSKNLFIMKDIRRRTDRKV